MTGLSNYPYGLQVLRASALALLTSSTQVLADFNLTKSVDLSQAGLRLKVLGDSQQIPMSPPTAHTVEFRNTASGKTWQEERYNPRELWAIDQFVGRWQDDEGNMMLVAEARYALDVYRKNEFIQLEDYTNKTRKKLGRPLTSTQLIEWAGAVVGSEVEGAPVDVRSTYRLKKIQRVSFKNQSNIVGYLFELKQSGRAAWFMVAFQVGRDRDLDRAIRHVESRFLSSVAPITRRGHATTSLYSDSIAAKGAGSQTSSGMQATRQRATSSIKNMRDWWYEETRNYIIVSDLSNESMVNRIKVDIEVMRRNFEAFYPPRQPIRAVSVVRVFANKDAYVSYVGNTRKWTAGLWMPNKKELVVSSSDWGSSKDKRNQMLRVVYHEAFHQYIHYAYNGVQSSVWFNEGMACFFEEADITNSRFNIKESKPYAKTIDTLIKKNNLDFARIVRLSYNDFYSGGQSSINSNYAQAWALCYFLQKGAANDDYSRYKMILSNYMRTLWKTKSDNQATLAAFKDIDMTELQADFIEFWTNKNLRSSIESKDQYTPVVH